MTRKLLIALTATVFALGTTACNTIQGLGQDIESVGKAGERAIDYTRLSSISCGDRPASDCSPASRDAHCGKGRGFCQAR